MSLDYHATHTDVLVHETTQDEARRLFERRCRDLLGTTAKKFLAAHNRGSYPDDWDQTAIAELEALLPFAR